MTRSTTQWLIAILSLATVTGAHAHEGHAVTTTPGDSLLHWLTHPDHILPLVAGVALVVVLGGLLVRHFRR
ncbi:UDP-glucose 4-epimerase [Thiohalobacter thiocyanaticus]|uniref:UDP-glucose 4-epimerase n=1 Tax=Thiohalobacter thiocyanaticus TaxID=585455 RepID=A0A1Z4VT62_9GAMM|nr:hypothetical protein [Thiohalobacter thiocyanaticus]BAZ94655.1 UDP-glucose 4-epimerase [Thiohalobacter thiocyanaticus]